ncbi:MAG: radical SAM protein [Anaerolineales bacterium]|nr:radical SAM protein [Anaerolineales bacterium]
MNEHQVSVVDPSTCANCGFCQEVLFCPSPEECVGCGVCVVGCPYRARKFVSDEKPRQQITINLNGNTINVPEKVTLKSAIERSGHRIEHVPWEGDLTVPCRTGGCWTCAVLVDGQLTRACVQSVSEGMVVQVPPPVKSPPLRIIHGPQPHSVGGKATPWSLKRSRQYIEVAIWTAGCNLRCPQCQNYTTTYDGTSSAVTPEEAARRVTRARHRYQVDRMAISGGEPTLNRRWLVTYFHALRKHNSDPNARLHLDSNGTFLTPDYIDELVEAGVTDIGVEPKGIRTETFMHITAICDRNLAQRYLTTAWEAIAHITSHHRDHVFLGVGLPYNQALIDPGEVQDFGRKLASIDPEIQVCVLDYFPSFRRRDISRPSAQEMLAIRRLLEGTGLKTVVVQTARGHFGPGD